MALPYSTASAASLLERHPDTIRRLAKEHGIGSRFGHSFAFSEDDIERLRGLLKDPKPFQRGNQFWRNRSRHGRFPKHRQST